MSQLTWGHYLTLYIDSQWLEEEGNIVGCLSIPNIMTFSEKCAWGQ